MNVLERVNLDEIESLVLDKKGLIKVVDAEVYKQFSHSHIKQLAHKHGLYCLPTTELIAWLKVHIAGRRAIEIGGGCGIIGRSLGIRSTDNYKQEMPKYKKQYEEMGQPTVKYGKDVLKCDALKAIKRFKPEVVIGCWVTHLYDPKEPLRKGNEIGIDEAKIIKLVGEYIVVGNSVVHGLKPILELPHEKLNFQWLVSRGFYSNANCIYSWKGKV